MSISETLLTPDLLLQAFNAVQQGDHQHAAALYDIAEARIRSKRAGLPDPEEWASLLMKRGDYHARFRQWDQANHCFLDAATTDPLGLAGQSIVALARGKVYAAIALGQQAVFQARGSAFAHVVLGRALLIADKPREAIAPLRFATRMGRADAAYELGQAWFGLGNYRRACAAYKRTLRINPAHAGASNNIFSALLGAGNFQDALTMADQALSQKAWNVEALAFKCAALAGLGRIEEERALANLDEIIVAKKVPVPSGYRDLAEFNEALREALEKEPTLQRSPKAHATRNGWHSSNLSQSNSPAVQALIASVTAAISDRYSAPNAPAGHSFYRARPAQFQLNLWTVIMDEGGHQIPHIHRRGWLSGVYYVNVPAGISPADQTHMGWLRFGPAEAHMQRKESPANEKLFCPQGGLMLTFPSYIWHSTLPFYQRGAARRISVAFDAMPA